MQSGRTFGLEQEGRELECGCPADTGQSPAAPPIGLWGCEEPLHLCASVSSSTQWRQEHIVFTGLLRRSKESNVPETQEIPW